MGDPACIRAEPKEATPRRRQERSARGAGRRERNVGPPGPGKKQEGNFPLKGRAWEEHVGTQRGGESDGRKKKL